MNKPVPPVKLPLKASERSHHECIGGCGETNENCGCEVCEMCEGTGICSDEIDGFTIAHGTWTCDCQKPKSIQMAGRVLRNPPKKQKVTIVDFGGKVINIQKEN